MTLKKNDFVEIEFTGSVKNGEIFDSNIKEDLEKLHAGHNHEIETKPLIICLGQQMFLDSIENFLMGKPETEATYEIELSPEKAFGKRNQSLITKIPTKVFIEHKLRPVMGEIFNFDGRIAKVLAVSGGRVIVDFNNPLAGKDVVYKLKIKRKVDSLEEKVKAMIDFLFRRNLKFEIKEKDKKIEVYLEPELKKFAEMFKEKFKEIFGMELEVKEIKEIETSKKEKKNEPVAKTTKNN